MGRVIILCLSIALAPAWGQLKERQDAPPATPATGGLIDEDEDIVQDPNYAFNPIQARKEFKIGGFYAKKSNHRAAAARFLEATKWDPAYAEAHWRLGVSREELKQYNLAIEAYRKYLQLEPNGKESKEALKRISRLEPLLSASPPVESGRENNSDADSIDKETAAEALENAASRRGR